MGAASFSERDCFNVLRGRYQTMAELRPGLKVLVERGYIFDKPAVTALLISTAFSYTNKQNTKDHANTTDGPLKQN